MDGGRGRKRRKKDDRKEVQQKNQLRLKEREHSNLRNNNWMCYSFRRILEGM